MIWNLGEENGPEGSGKPNSDDRGNTNAQRLAFAKFIKETDPYDHPIVVHTYPGDQDKVFPPLLGSPDFDGASLQLSPMSKTREQTLKWRRESAAAGRPWFVCLDEVGPANAGVLPDAADGAEANHRDVRRALWANLLSGGSGAEWYFGYKYPHNDLNLEDFRSRANVWRFSKTRPRVRRNRGPARVPAGAGTVRQRTGRRRPPTRRRGHAGGAVGLRPRRPRPGRAAARRPGVWKPARGAVVRSAGGRRLAGRRIAVDRRPRGGGAFRRAPRRRPHPRLGGEDRRVTPGIPHASQTDGTVLEPRPVRVEPSSG